MDELNSAQIKQLKQQLLGLAEQLELESASHKHSAVVVELDQTRVGRLSRMDAMQQQAQQQAELERAQLRLRRVHYALNQIDQAEYGWCAQCDEPIGFARLQVQPESTLCIACKSKSETH